VSALITYICDGSYVRTRSLNMSLLITHLCDVSYFKTHTYSVIAHEFEVAMWILRISSIYRIDIRSTYMANVVILSRVPSLFRHRTTVFVLSKNILERQLFGAILYLSTLKSQVYS
jgi:hypothetical protein